MEEPKEDLVIIRMRFLSIQVCTTLEDKEKIEEETERLSPAGTQRGWVFSSTEEIALVQCVEFPNRKHYVLVC